MSDSAQILVLGPRFETLSQSLSSQENTNITYLTTIVDNNSDALSNTYDIVLVVGYSEVLTELEKWLSIEREQNNYQLLVVLEQCENELVDACYLSGAMEVLVASSRLSLSARLQANIELVNQRKRAELQLREASDLAMLAMTNASDLGSMVEFAQKATQAKNYEQLAHSILDFITPLCEFALVELYTNGNYRQFGTGDQIDPDLLKLLHNIDRDKRIIRESDLVVLNDNSISIILAGLPINEPEKLGRILDSLATFISLSESFVSSLASKNVVANQEVKQKEFLGVIGHELRTPINAIQGFSKIIAQQIQNNSIGENAFTLCERIELNCLKMADFVELSLDIERLASKKTKPMVTTITFEELLDSVFNYFGTALIEAKCIVNNQMMKKAKIKADEKRLYLTLRHLISTAIDGKPVGKLEINAELSEEMTSKDLRDKGSNSASPNFLKITLSNTEKYVPAKMICALNQNKSLQGAIKPNTDSRIAVGFLYAKLYLEKIGGTIRCSSSQEKGSCVTVYVPMAVD